MTDVTPEDDFVSPTPLQAVPKVDDAPVAGNPENPSQGANDVIAPPTDLRSLLQEASPRLLYLVEATAKLHYLHARVLQAGWHYADAEAALRRCVDAVSMLQHVRSTLARECAVTGTLPVNPLPLIPPSNQPYHSLAFILQYLCSTHPTHPQPPTSPSAPAVHITIGTAPFTENLTPTNLAAAQIQLQQLAVLDKSEDLLSSN